MEHLFSDRITQVPRSFIREILKVATDPSIVSFAGGLPNRKYFPVRQLEQATARVFATLGMDSLQYHSTFGIVELRETIAKRYQEKQGLDISPDSILITSGSQQGLDLLGKVLLNPGDDVIIEEPGYLGAIQSLSMFRPNFLPVPLEKDGMDRETLQQQAKKGKAKLLYCVPNFQNPSGISYSNPVREQVAAIAKDEQFIIVEDDPYGELRFDGEFPNTLYSYLPEQTVLLGSFSKAVAPGLRLGWLVAPPWLYDKLVVAKQAADLHTSSISQYIMDRYLRDNDLDAHLDTIKTAYGNQCKVMLDLCQQHLPAEVQFTKPEGGMFLWGTLPAHYDPMELFNHAMQEKVVFVPGTPFYTHSKKVTTFRLSFSCTEPEEINEGMQRLSRAIDSYNKTKIVV